MTPAAFSGLDRGELLGLLVRAEELLLPGFDTDFKTPLRANLTTAEWSRRRNDWLRDAGHGEVAARLGERARELAEAASL